MVSIDENLVPERRGSLRRKPGTDEVLRVRLYGGALAVGSVVDLSAGGFRVDGLSLGKGDVPERLDLEIQCAGKSLFGFFDVLGWISVAESARPHARLRTCAQVVARCTHCLCWFAPQTTLLEAVLMSCPACHPDPARHA